MKKTILIGLFFLLSCSKNENKDDTKIILENPDYSTEISSLTFDELDIQVTNPLSFGQLSTQNSESRVISLKNNSESSVAFSIQPLTDGYSISLNRCRGNIPAGKSCLIGVSFSKKGLYNGIYSSNLVLEKGANQLSIPLNAEVIGKPNPISAGTPNLELTLSSSFDSLNPPTRQLVVKNIGDGIAKNVQALIPVEFKVLINRCGSNDLYPGKVCSFGILFKDYKTAPAPGAVDFVVRSESNSSVSFLKKIDSHSRISEPVSFIYTGTYTDFPENPKTAICSGSISFTKTILSCKDQYNVEVDNGLCPAPDIINYQSPSGELSSPISITGGDSYYSCNLGSTEQYLSRVSCNVPNYWPNGLSCLAQSFTANYQVVSNPVPNSCDGSQTISKNIISGTCLGSISSIVHNDSYCPSTQDQLFQSPAGNKTITLTGGSKTVSCSSGSTSQTFQSFSCIAGRYFTPANDVSGICQSCNAGSYSNNNATACTSCPSGTYQSSPGSPACQGCTNPAADMSGVSSINYGVSSGLTSNSCPISSVNCVGGWANAVWNVTMCKPTELQYPRSGLTLTNNGTDSSLIGHSFEFVLQTDGNIVLYSLNSSGGKSGVIWTAGTGGRSCSPGNPCQLVYQSDGNLVAYQGGPYWNAGANPYNYFFINAGGVGYR